MFASKQKIVKSRWRWSVLLCLCLLNFSMAFSFVNLFGILNCASIYYGEPSDKILLIGDSSNLLFVVFGWLALILLPWRLDFSVIGATILVSTSLWLRYFAH